MKALQSKYINVNGFLLDLSSPCVMGKIGRASCRERV